MLVVDRRRGTDPSHSESNPNFAIRAPAALTIAAAVADAFDQPAPAGPALPDLVINPAPMLERGGLELVSPLDGEPFIRYNYAVANRGPGHMILIGSDPDPTGQVLKARQLAYQGNELVQVGERGRYESNGYSWEYKDTCSIKLEKVGLPGWKSEATKSHFAFADMGDAENPDPRDPSIPATMPGSVTFEGTEYQLGYNPSTDPRAGGGLTAGKYDLYGGYSNTPLQLPPGESDGRYLLTVTVDPHNNIVETDETNNVVRFWIEIENFRLRRVEPVAPGQLVSLEPAAR